MVLSWFSRALGLLLTITGSAVVHAQATTPLIPETKVVSPGGVDMRSGEYVTETADLSIGPEEGGLTFVRVPRNDDVKPFTSNWHFRVHSEYSSQEGLWYFQIENKAIAKTFRSTSTSGASIYQTGWSGDGISKLQIIPSGSYRYFLHTASDGTTTRFQLFSDASGDTWVEEIKRPDGFTYTFGYDTGGPADDRTRLRRVVSSTGFQFILEYYPSPNHGKISRVCAINTAFTTPPVSNTCPGGARSASYTYSGHRVASITNAAGAVSTITSNYVDSRTPFQESFYKPGVAQPWLTNSYVPDEPLDLQQYVQQQTFAGGQHFSYDFGHLGMGELPCCAVLTGLGWTENGQHTTRFRWGVVQGDTRLPPLITPGPTEFTDPLLRKTRTTYDGAGAKVTSLERPSGRKSNYTYNVNHSITQQQETPPTGSTDAVLTTSYTYDCAHVLNCQKPVTATDARGNTTNYTYDPTHGGLLTQTLPADNGGIRPQRRYTWSQFYPWYRNSAGSLVQGAFPVWLVSSISECRTQVSCAGTADETRTTFTYGTSGAANNLLLTQKTVAAGNGSVSATTTYTYDANGDKLSEDGPLPGSADTTVWKYDVMRRVVGVIGPDPDGGGALRHRAIRNTYDPAGRLTSVERGTTAGQSDAHWSGFAPIESVETDYDALDRKIKEAKKAGGATYALTQYSYDAFGRLECTAVRMNPATFGNLPGSACTLGTEGVYGPDRITRRFYDAAGQLVRTQFAVGTVDAMDEEKTYTANGKLESLTDGGDNRTTFEYDGHDRLVKTRYPVPAAGQRVSSTSDFEQLGYDANGNVTSMRRRDGQMIYSTFDALNRLTLKNLPPAEADVSYTYDLQARMLSATQGALVTRQSWDALGRMTSETNAGHTTSMLYDAAGRLTRITHGDGFYVSYNYNTVDLISILEYGASPLVNYGYDNLGRRTSLLRANDTTSTYSYDAISRLSGFAQDLPGTTYDLSVSNVAYNPASQITALTRSNQAYAWGGHENLDRSYGVNGLNQLTTAGAVSIGYDGRGNLTQNGTNLYSYTVENRLSSGPNGGAVSYDPLGRIAQVTQGSATTKFEHLGSRLIMERDSSGAILRRYVHGPGDDEPVVWYEGSGTSGRRFLQTDERGSVVAITSASGGLVGVNSYDEYGVPAASNIGRFQYTGQAWIPELKLAYYKARMYDPQLGRFMQTDPVGYEDDVNLYAYVGNDPLNKTDPTGMYESHWLLRALVPGQVTFDNAMTAAENGNYGQAGALMTAMVGEQVLTAASLPAGAVTQTTRAVVSAEGKNLSLKYKTGWSAAQRAAADKKVGQLDAAAKRGELRASTPERSGTSARSRFEADGGQVNKGQDVDHVKDLQLGGKDVTGNMQALDSSVNRSLGSQVNQQIKDLPKGTPICGATICN